jgi:prophage regulatory protein
MANDYILRLPQVIVRTGLGRTSIYKAINAGRFPAPVALGARSVGWYESSIARWIEERPPACGSAGGAWPHRRGATQPERGPK